MSTSSQTGYASISVALDSSVLFSLPYQPIMPGLNIVATPIGNLADITLRAVMALLGADVVVCEDTRHTKKLLSAYGLKKKCITYNDHSDQGQRNKLLKLLVEGKSVAMVSDAGMPLISDPGYKLVQDVIHANLPITCYPGANAALTGLVKSGLPTERFLFVGFLPPRDKARREKLQDLSTVPVTLIFYESANRLLKVAKATLEIFGDRPCAFSRELTKKFEASWSGTLSSLVSYLEEDTIKGECVFLVRGAVEKSREEWDDTVWQNEAISMSQDHPLKEVANVVANKYNLSKRLVYQFILNKNG